MDGKCSKKMAGMNYLNFDLLTSFRPKLEQIFLREQTKAGNLQNKHILCADILLITRVIC